MPEKLAPGGAGWKRERRHHCQAACEARTSQRGCRTYVVGARAVGLRYRPGWGKPASGGYV